MNRRLVVVVFLDLVGWTRLAERVDPEPLQEMLERYYDLCSTSVGEHGGEVEKFIGDAVMAVFGATRSQEDDALRALRTVLQIRAGVSALSTPGTDVPSPSIHCGIAGGEALVARSPRAGLRVVGDVVNLAARLQSVAGPDEVLVNDVVAQLARPEYLLAPVPPLSLKGKTHPVPAWRVDGQATHPATTDDSRIVDRVAELARIQQAYQEVAARRRGQVLAVLGPPGIGKSRLVSEAVAGLDTAATRPGVVAGSCPSYGRGAHSAALGQVLAALTGPGTRGGELARADHRIRAVLAGLRPGTAGRAGEGAAPGVEEIAWAAGALLTAAAAEPLVVVWDSLEWAGAFLHRLIDGLAAQLAEHPVLMVCVARTDLVESETPWLRHCQQADVIDLEPLSPVDSTALVASLAITGDAEVQAHELDLIDQVCGYGAGNPLFLRLMWETSRLGGPLGEAPPSITAMVGAMIDRLPVPARELLGAAAVIGATFTLDQLAWLQPVAPAAVEVLVNRQLLRAGRTDGEYHFSQQPVHEVAYGRLAKELRLGWHQCLAGHGVDPGFHLEAAARLLGDLRPLDPQLPRLAGRGAAELVAEGTAALRQRDLPAAIGLLERALRLVPDTAGECHAVSAIRLSDALLLAGRTAAACEVVDRVGRQSSDPAVRRCCEVQGHLLALRVGIRSEAPTTALRAGLPGTDRLGRCRLEQLQLLLHLRHGRYRAAEQAACAALDHARAIADSYEEERMLAALCEIRQWSPTPVAERLAGCVQLAERFTGDRFLLVPVLAAQARCLALMGREADAREVLVEAQQAVDALRLTMGRVLIDQAAALVHSLAGDHAQAAQRYAAAARALESAGHQPVGLTVRVLAARERARHANGQAVTEVERLLRRRHEMDLRGRVLLSAAACWLAVPADRGAPLPSEVEALAEATDDPCLRGEVYFDLARTYRRRGDEPGARAMAGRAIDCYASVGATVPMAAVRSWR